MSLLYFIVIGLIAGWLAAKLIRGGGFGLIGNMVVGMIGAVIGGSLMSMAGVNAGSGLFASIGGATILSPRMPDGTHLRLDMHFPHVGLFSACCKGDSLDLLRPPRLQHPHGRKRHSIMGIMPVPGKQRRRKKRPAGSSPASR